jgi:hypothetical protein
MDLYDNPAGRLYELLRKLSEVTPDTPVVKAWAQVLNVPNRNVPLHLARVGQLVADVQEAVDKADAGAFSVTVTRYRDDWANAIFPTAHAFTVAVKNVRPGAVALEALAGVATHLHAVASEGKIPDETELEHLKEQVRNLLEEVKESTDLPDNVKHLLTIRLTGVLSAVQQVAIGGPNAVRFATEALVGAIAVQGPGTSRSGTAKRVVATLGIIWVAFSAGPTVQNSLEAWSGLFHGELDSGATHATNSHEPERADSDEGSR